MPGRTEEYDSEKMNSSFSRFLECAFPVDAEFSIVFDNARTHQEQPVENEQRLPQTPRKLCRWDSSLSVRECTHYNLSVPKRRSISSIDSYPSFPDLSDCSTVPNDGKELDEDDLSESVDDVSCCSSSIEFDICLWANETFSVASREKIEPPRMPRRQSGYFPEAEDREQ